MMGGLGPHAYAAGKHAVVGMTKNVAAELCHVGIRVNAIAAASMATPMVANVLTGDPSNIEEAKRILAEVSPLSGRPGLADGLLVAADRKVSNDDDVRSFCFGEGQVRGDRQAREVAERRAERGPDARPRSRVREAEE